MELAANADPAIQQNMDHLRKAMLKTPATVMAEQIAVPVAV
jgi:hypothetical protein